MAEPDQYDAQAAELLPCDMPNACDTFNQWSKLGHLDNCSGKFRPAVAAALRKQADTWRGRLHNVTQDKRRMGQDITDLRAEIDRLAKFVVYANQLEHKLNERQAEIDKLRVALKEIVNPIAVLQANLPIGVQLNGIIAVQLCNDPVYLKEIARKALGE